jgi:hypothetical protein
MYSALRMVVRTLGWVTLSVVLLVLAIGCSTGPAKVNVSGKVVMAGQPLKVSDQGEVRVKFYSEGTGDENSISKPAAVDSKTGAFTIKNIPMGKYKITVQQIDPMPSTDVLERRFDRTNSRIIREVESDGQVIDIDLAKEAG